MIGFGQFTSIPDAAFRNALQNLGIMPLGNNTVYTASIDTMTYLNVGGLSISDLTGIEDFTALTALYCSPNQITSLNLSQNTALTTLNCTYNQLTSLDLSQNTALTFLDCSENQITSLNVSQNTALTYLACVDNQLTILDVTQNIALTILVCYINQLTSLDVSQNTALTSFICSYNQLTSLDLSQNTALTTLYCQDNQLTSLDSRNGNNQNTWNFGVSNNPLLTCINVDNVSYSSTNWTDIDSQHWFSTNCPAPVSIEEQTTNKDLLKVTDLLGGETKGSKNEPLFYIYNDGTVEKRIVIE
jgi:Leucine-rich repeat (LRR) protein